MIIGENMVRNVINLYLFWIKRLLFIDGVRAKIYIRAKPNYIEGRNYLSLEQVKMDFTVKDIKMGVENVHNSNTVLRKYF